VVSKDERVLDSPEPNTAGRHEVITITPTPLHLRLAVRRSVV
jgi:hypothetical protein